MGSCYRMDVYCSLMVHIPVQLGTEMFVNALFIHYHGLAQFVNAC